MKKTLFLLTVIMSFSFLLFSCAPSVSVSQYVPCQQTYDYFPDAEDCLQRKFLDVAISLENNVALQTIHTDIISILKQNVYETKIANSEAWFEYNDMFKQFSISETKQHMLESYLKVLEN